MVILQDHSNTPGYLLNLCLVSLGDDNGNGNLEGAVCNLSIKFQNSFSYCFILFFTLGGYLPIFEA